MQKLFDVIVIGGGQSGLATGYHLQKKGLSFVILEANDQAVGSWPNYYDSLKLFSPAKYSSLPGLAFPGEGNRYPRRDEVINYLQTYAHHFQLPIHYQQHVVKVLHNNGSFQVTTGRGGVYLARHLICATGSFSRPYFPEINNQDMFQGNVLHASEYKSPARFQGERIIVVGRANSAVQIAIELAEIAQVTLAVRQPVSLMPQKLLGLDAHFWLRVTGIDSVWQKGKKLASNTNVMDTGGYKARLAAGNPPQRQMFTQFTRDGVIWADGEHQSVDSVIFATGYRPNLSFLEVCGAVDSEGKPMHSNGIGQQIPGLYFVGLPGQRSFASATLRGVGRDAEFIVRHILRTYRR